MKSMTSYGKSIYIDDKYEIHIELKSVNSKNFDLKIWNCKELFFLENEMTAAIFKYIKRGKIDIRITFKDKQIPNIEIDENKLTSFYNVLENIKNKLNLDEIIKLDTILAQSDIVIIEKLEYDNDSFRKVFYKCLNEAINNHQILSKKEGDTLKSFFIKSITIIEENLYAIKKTIPNYKEKLKNNLIHCVKQILSTDMTEDIEKRILIETALYIEKCDITEEIIRIESHLSNIKDCLQHEHDESGKILNFIFQEMQREANTISAKYHESNSFKSILLIKLEIEKCREQIQNVE